MRERKGIILTWIGFLLMLSPVIWLPIIYGTHKPGNEYLIFFYTAVSIWFLGFLLEKDEELIKRTWMIQISIVLIVYAIVGAICAIYYGRYI